MALRFTVQYADPNGPHPLAHDAAWQVYSTTDHADVALADVEQAGRRHLDRQTARIFPPYAVRILDGADVVMVDVPGAVPDPDEVDAEQQRRADLDAALDQHRADFLDSPLSDAVAAYLDATEPRARVIR
jgi:hypothetical protein